MIKIGVNVPKNHSEGFFSDFFVSTVSRLTLYRGFASKWFCWFSTVSWPWTQFKHYKFLAKNGEENFFNWRNYTLSWQKERRKQNFEQNFYSEKRICNNVEERNASGVSCNHWSCNHCNHKEWFRSSHHLPIASQNLYEFDLKQTNFKKVWNFFFFPTLFKMLFLQLQSTSDNRISANQNFG